MLVIQPTRKTGIHYLKKTIATCTVPCDAPFGLWCSRGWRWRRPQCYALLSSFALGRSRSLRKSWCMYLDKREETHLNCRDRDPGSGGRPHGRGWQSQEWSWGGSSRAQEHPSENTWKRRFGQKKRFKFFTDKLPLKFLLESVVKKDLCAWSRA